MTNTKTERRLAITPGDWQADNYSVLDAEGHEVVSTDNRELTILIADAGTTYNTCGLTPSELLAKVTEAATVVRSLLDEAYTLHSDDRRAANSFLSNLPQ